VRDFGGLNLTLAVVTIAALVVGTRALVRTAALAWLAWSVPHLAYHLADLGRMSTGDAIANVVTVSLSVVIPILLLATGSSASGTGAACAIGVATAE